MRKMLVLVFLLALIPGCAGSPLVAGLTSYGQHKIPIFPSGLPGIDDTPSTVKYVRDKQFGLGWTAGASKWDSCDTRGELIVRDSIPPAIDGTDTDFCADDGTIFDVYNWKNISASTVEADHVVALADAWRSGATTWSYQRRRDFSQDLDNLLAVDGSTNQKKSDEGPDLWNPPTAEGKCVRAEVYRGIKVEYGLTNTSRQQNAMMKILSSCGPILERLGH